VDRAFIEEFCRIHADASFWGDLGLSERVSEYLLRYAFWFFDIEFEGSRYMEDLMWQFKQRHHGFRPAPRQKSMPVDEALSVMGISRFGPAADDRKILDKKVQGEGAALSSGQGGES
jgi:hypothetical protein